MRINAAGRPPGGSACRLRPVDARRGPAPCPPAGPPHSRRPSSTCAARSGSSVPAGLVEGVPPDHPLPGPCREKAAAAAAAFAKPWRTRLGPWRAGREASLSPEITRSQVASRRGGRPAARRGWCCCRRRMSRAGACRPGPGRRRRCGKRRVMVLAVARAEIGRLNSGACSRPLEAGMGGAEGLHHGVGAQLHPVDEMRQPPVEAVARRRVAARGERGLAGIAHHAAAIDLVVALPVGEHDLDRPTGETVLQRLQNAGRSAVIAWRRSGVSPSASTPFEALSCRVITARPQAGRVEGRAVQRLPEEAGGVGARAQRVRSMPISSRLFSVIGMRMAESPAS